MEELNKLWQSIGHNKSTPEIMESQLSLKNAAESPLKKLKRNFQANLAFAVVFSFLFIILFIIMDGFWVRLFTGALLIGYFLAIYQTSIAYRKYLNEVHSDEQVKIYLQKVYHGINQMLRLQEISAIFFYPIALVAGFLMALYQKDGMDAFNENFTWVLLGVLIVVFTPLCYILAKYLNKLAFGKYLKQIKLLIDDFENEPE
jgi:hypothetical protein